MLESQKVLSQCGIASKHSTNTKNPLSAQSAQSLQRALKNDTAAHMRHALLALATGIFNIQGSLSTWPTVQLYYSVFYCARAWLSSQSICLFYSGTKPFSITSQAGQFASQEKGNTHKVTMSIFSRENAHSRFVSQQVDQKQPFEWLCSLREDANYKNHGPIEPDLATGLATLNRIGLRQAIIAYMKDDQSLYTFDKDHALLALPLHFFVETLALVRDSGIQSFDSEFLNIVTPLLSDRKGKLTALTAILAP